MAGNIRIIKAGEKDCEALAKLGAKTFYDAYNGKVNNLDSYIKKSFTKNKLLKEIKKPAFIFLIALKNNKPVGYAKLLGAKDSQKIELVRLYLLKNFQRQGIGSKLLWECIKIAKKNKFKVIWLGVWEKNRNAIAFYKKSGFKKFGQYKFKFETEIHNDLLMKRKIS